MPRLLAEPLPVHWVPRLLAEPLPVYWAPQLRAETLPVHWVPRLLPVPWRPGRPVLPRRPPCACDAPVSCSRHGPTPGLEPFALAPLRDPWMVADRRSHLRYLEQNDKRRYNALIKKLGLKK